jgi:hypothetical protein
MLLVACSPTLTPRPSQPALVAQSAKHETPALDKLVTVCLRDAKIECVVEVYCNLAGVESFSVEEDLRVPRPTVTLRPSAPLERSEAAALVARALRDQAGVLLLPQGTKRVMALNNGPHPTNLWYPTIPRQRVYTWPDFTGVDMPGANTRDATSSEEK